MVKQLEQLEQLEQQLVVNIVIIVIHNPFVVIVVVNNQSFDLYLNILYVIDNSSNDLRNLHEYH